MEITGVSCKTKRMRVQKHMYMYMYIERQLHSPSCPLPSKVLNHTVLTLMFPVFPQHLTLGNLASFCRVFLDLHPREHWSRCPY